MFSDYVNSRIGIITSFQDIINVHTPPINTNISNIGLNASILNIGNKESITYINGSINLGSNFINEVSQKINLKYIVAVKSRIQID